MNTADEKTITHTLSDESKVKITGRSDKDINDAAVLLEQIHDDKLPTINVRLWLNVLYLVVLPASIIATVLSRNTFLHLPITIGSIIILFVVVFVGLPLSMWIRDLDRNSTKEQNIHFIKGGKL